MRVGVCRPFQKHYHNISSRYVVSRQPKTPHVIPTILQRWKNTTPNLRNKYFSCIMIPTYIWESFLHKLSWDWHSTILPRKMTVARSTLWWKWAHKYYRVRYYSDRREHVPPQIQRPATATACCGPTTSCAVVIVYCRRVCAWQRSTFGRRRGVFLVVCWHTWTWDTTCGIGGISSWWIIATGKVVACGV